MTTMRRDIERGPAARSTCAMVAFVIESTQHVYVRKENEFQDHTCECPKVRLKVNEFTDLDNQ